jgi:type I restriction enzyme M protein
VKTNVIFLTRGKTDRANTKAVWVYDMRANMPAFGKTRTLTVADFAAFEAAFGGDPTGGGARDDEGLEGRFRCFSRAEIAMREDNLDIAWLRDDSVEHDDDLSEPSEIAEAIIGHLRAALNEIEAVTVELAGEEAAPEKVEV